MNKYDKVTLAKDLSNFTNKYVVSMRDVIGGYTLAKRYIVSFEDGSSVFAKVATNNDTANWLRAEHNFYSHSEYSFHPKMIGWQDTPSQTFILLEDLSQAEWSYSWTENRIQSVLDGLRQLALVQAPKNLPTISELHSDLFCWDAIMSDPSIFIESGLADRNTLKKALFSLKTLADAANIEGPNLVHMDIRSDNICFRDNKAIFVDWNHACTGNPKIDTLFWLPSLYLEGGTAPWDFGINEPELLSLILGYFVYNASLAAPHLGSDLRNFQRKQLEVVYEWINRM